MQLKYLVFVLFLSSAIAGTGPGNFHEEKDSANVNDYGDDAIDRGENLSGIENDYFITTVGVQYRF
ncbi:hypothetical protein J5069_18570 [Candidatus Symbiopectobacterium sp. NZEC127]|uniref:hypothetical protein n=1 Tax=Candidatus Symbiopectobacterium sp. NZEC127 TaxID=2820472 RepID=UPI002225DA05|nr:hypothetical protein [Candidatus Symbiopectobacterium sp. NZEC127]MCW2487907.1 hypothetical protein [Candidatus Symbiopectobacterium sp. NZEC127]